MSIWSSLNFHQVTFRNITAHADNPQFSYHSHLRSDNTKLALVKYSRTLITITCGPHRQCRWMTPRVKHDEVNSSHVREMRVVNNGGGCAARESKGGQKANERRRGRTHHAAPPGARTCWPISNVHRNHCWNLNPYSILGSLGSEKITAFF